MTERSLSSRSHGTAHQSSAGGVSSEQHVGRAISWRLHAVVGLAGLFHGATGPLLSSYVPVMLRSVVGDDRSRLGMLMAIDNVLLLMLVPLAGALSDRGAASGRGRLPLIYAGLILAAFGMALLPLSSHGGLQGIVGALLVLYAGTSIVRPPFHALTADLVPSQQRSIAQGSYLFQMYGGAIAFLILGRLIGVPPALVVASGAILVIALTFAMALDETRVANRAPEVTYRALWHAALSMLSGVVAGLRPTFIATFLLYLMFQTFTTWFALHGMERFGLGSDDVTIGFLAWSVGGTLGALPAGWLGSRFGWRLVMLLGFGLLSACLVALHLATNLGQLFILLAMCAAAWTLPASNVYPMFIERIQPSQRGVLAGTFLLSLALAGAVGDPLNGYLFDVSGGYELMFLLMSSYAMAAFATVLTIPRS